MVTRIFKKPIDQLVICSVISFFMGFNDARAQNIDFYENAVRSVTSGFRPVFCPTLPEPDRTICRTVSIRVERNWAFLAYANRSGITVSAGIGWIFDTMQWARTLSNEIEGSDDCFNAYMAYVFNGIATNTQRANVGLPLKPVYSVVDFPRNTNSCPDIDKASASKVVQNEAATHAREVESSLAFFLLHELAHVVLGHTRIDPSRLSLEQKRRLETDADTWAIHTANRSDYIIAGSMAPYFIGSIQGNSVDWEENSDHPLGVRRLANFYDLIVEDLEQNPKRRESLEENYESVLEDAIRLKKESNSCLKKIENGSSC